MRKSEGGKTGRFNKFFTGPIYWNERRTSRWTLMATNLYSKITLVKRNQEQMSFSQNPSWINNGKNKKKRRRRQRRMNENELKRKQKHFNNLFYNIVER